MERYYRKEVKRENEMERVESVDKIKGMIKSRRLIKKFNDENKEGVSGWFLIVEVDYMKKINEKYGNKEGEDEIIEVDKELEDSL